MPPKVGDNYKAKVISKRAHYDIKEILNAEMASEGKRLGTIARLGVRSNALRGVAVAYKVRYKGHASGHDEWLCSSEVTEVQIVRFEELRAADTAEYLATKAATAQENAARGEAQPEPPRRSPRHATADGEPATGEPAAGEPDAARAPPRGAATAATPAAPRPSTSQAAPSSVERTARMNARAAAADAANDGSEQRDAAAAAAADDGNEHELRDLSRPFAIRPKVPAGMNEKTGEYFDRNPNAPYDPENPSNSAVQITVKDKAAETIVTSALKNAGELDAENYRTEKDTDDTYLDDMHATTEGRNAIAVLYDHGDSAADIGANLYGKAAAASFSQITDVQRDADVDNKRDNSCARNATHVDIFTCHEGDHEEANKRVMTHVAEVRTLFSRFCFSAARTCAR